jgi:hypothetical protein
VTFKNNLLFFGDKIFEARIYKWVDPEEIKAAQKSVQDAS